MFSNTKNYSRDQDMILEMQDMAQQQPNLNMHKMPNGRTGGIALAVSFFENEKGQQNQKQKMSTFNPAGLHQRRAIVNPPLDSRDDFSYNSLSSNENMYESVNHNHQSNMNSMPGDACVVQPNIIAQKNQNHLQQKVSSPANHHNTIWNQLQEIADHARTNSDASASTHPAVAGGLSSPHHLESSSSSSGGSTGESDSLGSSGSLRHHEYQNQVRTSAANNGAISKHTKLSLLPLSSDERNVEEIAARLSPMVVSRPSSYHKKRQQQQNNFHQKQFSNSSPQNGSIDLGYHTLSSGSSPNHHHTHQGSTLSSSSAKNVTNVRATPTPSLGAASNNSNGNNNPNIWDVRATKTPISELHILTHNAKHTPVAKARSSINKKQSQNLTFNVHQSFFDLLPDDVVVRILSNLPSAQIARCARLSRRFYFLAWDPSLWEDIWLSENECAAANLDADLALKTVIRILARNSNSNQLTDVRTLVAGGCHRLTDRGLAILARRCPNLRHLEVQRCVNITNGGIMDFLTKCNLIEHLDVSGCPMISTITIHQPQTVQPQNPLMLQDASRSSRLLNLQFLDLTDCESLEDSGLKMVVETCPNLLYLFLRRCERISDLGVKYVASYCPSLREFSVSDCGQITDFGLYELAKLGPNLRYLSVAKCDRISDSGVKQITKLCYKLRYLNVRGCEAVSDEAVEALARSCSRLRSLDIGKCDVTDVGLKTISEHCPNLKKLSIKSCEMVSDEGIKSVSYFCRGLQHLNVQDTPITVGGYRTVKKLCRKCIIEHSNPGFY